MIIFKNMIFLLLNRYLISSFFKRSRKHSTSLQTHFWLSINLRPLPLINFAKCSTTRRTSATTWHKISTTSRRKLDLRLMRSTRLTGPTSALFVPNAESLKTNINSRSTLKKERSYTVRSKQNLKDPKSQKKMNSRHTTKTAEDLSSLKSLSSERTFRRNSWMYTTQLKETVISLSSLELPWRSNHFATSSVKSGTKFLKCWSIWQRLSATTSSTETTTLKDSFSKANAMTSWLNSVKTADGRKNSKKGSQNAKLNLQTIWSNKWNPFKSQRTILRKI